jgi:hypothetical protein
MTKKWMWTSVATIGVPRGHPRNGGLILGRHVLGRHAKNYIEGKQKLVKRMSAEKKTNPSLYIAQPSSVMTKSRVLGSFFMLRE